MGTQATAPQSRGETTIANTVVAKIGGFVTRKVAGVYAVGESGTKPLGRIRPGGIDYTRGVHVDVGAAEIAADVTVIAEFGVPLQQLCDRVRAEVFTALQELTGKRVVEVNVEVANIHVPNTAGHKELP